MLIEKHNLKYCMLYSVTQRSISFLYSIYIFSINTPQDESLKKVQSNSISIVAMYDENDGGGQRCRCYERLTFATKKMHSPRWSLGFFLGGGGDPAASDMCV